MNEGHCPDDVDEDDTVSYTKYQKLSKNQSKAVKQSLFTVCIDYIINCKIVSSTISHSECISTRVYPQFFSKKRCLGAW